MVEGEIRIKYRKRKLDVFLLRMFKCSWNDSLSSVYIEYITRNKIYLIYIYRSDHKIERKGKGTRRAKEVGGNKKRALIAPWLAIVIAILIPSSSEAGLQGHDHLTTVPYFLFLNFINSNSPTWFYYLSNFPSSAHLFVVGT